MSIFLFPLFFSFRPYAAQYLYIPNKVQTNENLNRFFFLFQSQQQTNKKKAHESSIEFEGRKTCMSRRKNREREKLFFFVFMSMAHFNSFAKKATTRMYIQGNRRRNKKNFVVVLLLAFSRFCCSLILDVLNFWSLKAGNLKGNNFLFHILRHQKMFLFCITFVSGLIWEGVRGITEGWQKFLGNFFYKELWLLNGKCWRVLKNVGIDRK